MKNENYVKGMMLLSVMAVTSSISASISNMNYTHRNDVLQNKVSQEFVLQCAKVNSTYTDLSEVSKVTGVKPMPKKQQKPVTTEKPKPKVIYVNVPLSHDLQDLIKALSKELGIEESLIYGTIDLESDFHPSCESAVGAKGLMQIGDSTYSWMHKDMKSNCPKLYSRVQGKSVWDNSANIITGVYHLKYLKRHCPSGLDDDEVYHYMLTAYNRGMGGAHSFNRHHGTYSSAYSREVLKRTDKYEDMIQH